MYYTVYSTLNVSISRQTFTDCHDVRQLRKPDNSLSRIYEANITYRIVKSTLRSVNCFFVYLSNDKFI